MTSLGLRSSRVRLIPQPERFSDLGWITRKKNLLVDAGTRENIVVVHDRYSLPADFIANMARFGGDFDVLVPRQTSTDGQPLPDWVTLSDYLNWSTPGWLEFGDFHPFGYVNGGVIVAKRERLKRTRWSELLFWGQAEDIDLSRRLQDAGTTPRPARDIRVLSEPPRAGFVEGFERIPWIEEFYPRSPRPDREHVTTTGPMALASASTAFVRTGEMLGFDSGDGVRKAISAGYMFHRGWSPSADSLIWRGKDDPGLSLRVNGPHIDLSLVLTFSDATAAANLISVRVNGSKETPLDRQGAVINIAIPQTVVTDSNILHFWMKASGGPLSLRSVQLNGAPRPVQRSARRSR